MTGGRQLKLVCSSFLRTRAVSERSAGVRPMDGRTDDGEAGATCARKRKHGQESCATNVIFRVRPTGPV